MHKNFLTETSGLSGELLVDNSQQIFKQHKMIIHQKDLGIE